MRQLEGKVAIVTGGSSGINREIALRFAQEGAKVAICSIDSDEMRASVVADIAQGGGESFAKRVDVGSREEIHAFVDEVVRKYGGLDILVNGAAYMMGPVPMHDLSVADWDRSLSVGVTSAFHFMRAAFPHMKDKGGRILGFSSIGGLRGVKGGGGYAAAKTALIGLTRSAANDWAQYGITANLIAPMAMSPSWAEFMAAQPTGADPFISIGTRRNAVNYAGDPLDDVAPAALFLCSDGARYITGHILPVDGGLLELE